MAFVVTPDRFNALHPAAEELYRMALDLAEDGGALLDPADPPEAQATAIRVQALVFCFQTVTLAAGFSEAEAMIALGAAAATIIGQCQSAPRALFDLYNAQMARSLAEIRAAREPIGHA